MVHAFAALHLGIDAGFFEHLGVALALVAPPATPGRCRSPASAKFFRCCVPAAAARCASSPSSPTAPRCATSSSTSVSRPRQPASRPPAVRRRGTCPMPGRVTSPPSPAGTHVRVRSTHRLATPTVHGPPARARSAPRMEECRRSRLPGDPLVELEGGPERRIGGRSFSALMASRGSGPRAGAILALRGMHPIRERRDASVPLVERRLQSISMSGSENRGRRLRVDCG